MIGATTIALLVLSVLYQPVHGGLVGSDINGCDVSHGNWVFDDSYPFYAAPSCPFIENEFDCIKNGRPDKDYLKYRWQPSACNLPKFDGSRILTEFRGKSIMFIGDSLSLNQWQSLTCMLHTAVPKAKYTLVRTGGLSTFTFPPHLVPESSSLTQSQLRMRNCGWESRWDLIQVGKQTYTDMNRLVAYEKALNTWASWVNSNVDPNKTKVFFQGVSPDHSNATEWSDPKAINCNAQSKPLPGPDYPGKAHPAEEVVEKVLRSMSKPVHLLDVTTLSQLRKDGHPSVYGLGGHRGMDCSHWCLAGVPDTWNVVAQIRFSGLGWESESGLRVRDLYL
ncbi:Plant protein of unknown function D [Prunus dulcis]|uniref:Uncharacterized protein n=1 Tax=Prunus dulcis TaxID=3755 RepID=A0A4Y1R559_PRUDU|nr:Plant protein of unknown function D [Prunus dulcis]